MRKNKVNNIVRILVVVVILLFVFNINYAQQSEKITMPDLNVVPSGLAKASLQLYNEKSGKLKLEIGKLAEEKKALNQKCKGLVADSPEDKKCQADLAALTPKLNDLTQRVNLFNTEIEEIVFKDPALDKLSIVTYYTLKSNKKLWDEFQKEVTASKTKLNQDKVKIQQELTKVKSKKHKVKIPFEEGVILSMCDVVKKNDDIEDSLKSPFTGVCYKNLGTGVVFVSFSLPKNSDSEEGVGQAIPETFSLATTEAKTALNELKEKKFNRLIAHSNGATVAECLLKDSLIEIKELNIIGGDKSLLNGQALQQLLADGSVKRIVVWVNLNDPRTWITTIDERKIVERTDNFISYKTKFKWEEDKLGEGKVEYKWILGNNSLNSIGAKDPQFVETYFKEISKEFSKK